MAAITNQGKCSKSRLVTTSAIKHFTPKVAEFYPKSGVVLGASIYVKRPRRMAFFPKRCLMDGTISLKYDRLSYRKNLSKNLAMSELLLTFADEVK